MVPQPYMDEIAAQTVPHHIYKTDGDGAWLHKGAGLKTPLIEVMPEGAQINVSCWQPGDTPKGTNNNIWLHGTYQSPKKGLIEGDVTDNFVDTHWRVTGDLTNQGIKRCGTTATAPVSPPAPTASQSAAQPAKPKSVFYSPWTPQAGYDDMKGKVADVEVPVGEWSNGEGKGCSTEKAVNVINKVPRNVDTISGWSLGRIGVVYYLMGAGDQQLQNIHNIILFDPGSTSDIAGPGVRSFRPDPACDYKLGPALALSQWLDDPEGKNRLMVLTGRDTEMKTDPSDPSSKSNYTELWKTYLPEIWKKTFADRTVICDYNDMEHHDIFRTYYDVVKSHPANCPPARDEHALTAWHP
jgi:hypothetical protein